LSLFFKKAPFWGKATLIFVVSLALECSQYILAVGSFDITDLITNTAGGLVGYCFYLIGRALLRDKNRAERSVAILIDAVTVLLVGGIFLIVLQN
jgi:glycopeptide antibiotics resistance protein